MSTTSEETEIAVYAYVEDQSPLQEAESIEKQIQVESTLISGARIRGRKITQVKGGPVGAGDRYEATIKIKKSPEGGVPSSMEVTQETDRGWFVSFSEVAERGIVKTRYTFMGKQPVITGLDKNIVLPAVKYEVDVFVNPTTKQPSKWVKIDIELDAVITALKEQGIDISGVKQKFNLDNLPFTATNMFSPDAMNDKQKQLISHLWENEFSQKLAPSIYVKKTDQQ